MAINKQYDPKNAYWLPTVSTRVGEKNLLELSAQIQRKANWSVSGCQGLRGLRKLWSNVWDHGSEGKILSVQIRTPTDNPLIHGPWGYKS